MVQLSDLQSTIFLFSVISFVVLIVYALSSKFKDSLQTFLVSNRSLGPLVGALSISAAWVWAPALFISSQKAFESGLPGIFWFTLPNALALVLIGIFATKLKSYNSNGYTLPEFIKMRLGQKNHLAYVIIILIVQLYSLILHLTATNMVLTSFTTYNREVLIFVFAITFLILAGMRGIRSSIFADLMKITFIIFIVLLIVPIVVMRNGGVQKVLLGIGGISGNFSNIFDVNIFLTFGIAISISLLSAAVIDQQLWQRAFSIKKGYEKKAFYIGSVFFFFIPAILSSLGFIGAANHITSSNNQLIGYDVISNTLPLIGVMLFVFTIIITMVAAGSSALCAVSSIASIDIYGEYINKSSTETQRLLVGRISMVIILIIATLISLIPNIQLLYLVLLIGAIRGALLIPTFFAIFRKNLSSSGAFYGIVFGVVVGLPVFVYGSLTKQPLISNMGSLLTLLLSFLTITTFNRLKPEYFEFKQISNRDRIKSA